ncbi:MAG: hypothetical protein EBQ96_09275 [Proteobacteria bacterium]|nr:hypothetical protein [Pseudomonadota bacterium]
MDKSEGATLRFFFDTEFNDEVGGMRVELISMAFVSEDGEREFYAECSEFSEDAAHPWLKENVLPHLGPRERRLPVNSIEQGLRKFFADAVRASPERVTKVQIWAKNGSNDFTVLGLAFGGLSKFYAFMNELGIERSYFNDTDMLRRELKEKVKIERDPKHIPHHALGDARHERREYVAIQAALRVQKLALAGGF